MNKIPLMCVTKTLLLFPFNVPFNACFNYSQKVEVSCFCMLCINFHILCSPRSFPHLKAWHESIFPPSLDFGKFDLTIFSLTVKLKISYLFLHNLAFFAHKSKEIERGGMRKKFLHISSVIIVKVIWEKKSLLMRILRTQNLITFSCHLNYVPCLLCEKLFFH